MRACNFFVSGPTFTDFLLPNVGGVVVDHFLFRFSIFFSAPEIFAIKVQSCTTSPRVVRPEILRVQAPEHLYANVHLCIASHHVDKFGEVTLTGLKLRLSRKEKNYHKVKK